MNKKMSTFCTASSFNFRFLSQLIISSSLFTAWAEVIPGVVVALVVVVETLLFVPLDVDNRSEMDSKDEPMGWAPADRPSVEALQGTELEIICISFLINTNTN